MNPASPQPVISRHSFSLIADTVPHACTCRSNDGCGERGRDPVIPALPRLYQSWIYMYLRLLLPVGSQRWCHAVFGSFPFWKSSIYWLQILLLPPTSMPRVYECLQVILDIKKTRSLCVNMWEIQYRYNFWTFTTDWIKRYFCKEFSTEFIYFYFFYFYNFYSEDIFGVSLLFTLHK